jgi:hypothetical protein
MSDPFHLFNLPTGESAWIPADIELKNPENSSLETNLLHYLIYIPWHDKYLERIDEAYRDFFITTQPYLRVRTTDVHVATCFPFTKEIIQNYPEEVDERVVRVAFILHDSGWSHMTEMEIAESLGVQGLALRGEAIMPKARHAFLGQEIAQRILMKYPFTPPLKATQKEQILQAILYHDKPEELEKRGKIPPALSVVCDVDHLWSFTHENFWQDTVRKGVNPEIYLENLDNDLESYLVTESGKLKAWQELETRRGEVSAWKSWLAGQE